MIYDNYSDLIDSLGQRWLDDELSREQYSSEEAGIIDDFRRELWAEYYAYDISFEDSSDIENKLWGLAWEYGHSAGLSEVESYYLDLVELVNLV